MATIAEWDGGSLPTIVGSTPAVVDAAMMFGEGSAANHATWTFGGVPQVTARWYMTLPASWASASWTFAELAGSPLTARTNLAGSGSPGQARLINSAGTQIANSSGSTVALAGTYRIEVQADRTAGTLRLAVFPLLSDTALYDSGAVSTSTGSTDPTTLRIGRVSAGVTVADLTISRVKAVDSIADWVGRHPADAATGGFLGVWDGTAILPTEILGVWNGSSIDPAAMLGVWDGTAILPTEI